MYLAEEDLQHSIATKDLPALWQAAYLIAHGVTARYYSTHPLRQDLAQDATLHIMRHIGKYNPEQSTAFTWITSLARYGVLQSLKDNRRRTRNEVPLENWL